MVDAVIEWSESNGATPTVTDGIDECNFGSVDETGLDPSVNKIVAGENSFEKWLRLHIASNPDSHDISTLKVWLSRGSNPYGSTYLKTNARESAYGGAETYAQPSASDRSATYHYTQNMPTVEPTGANLGIGGSLSGTMTSGYSDYFLMQLQIGANDVKWQEMELEYSYIEA